VANYAEIDAEIRRWAEAHSLVLFTEFAGRESRFAYVSSTGSECFQIWIELPVSGQVAVHVACVEGRRDLEPPYKRFVATAEIGPALEKAFEMVLKWMTPSERYFPEKRP